MEKAHSCGYSLPGLQDPLGLWGGVTQRQMESKASFPAEENPPEKTRELHFLSSSWFCG